MWYIVFRRHSTIFRELRDIQTSPTHLKKLIMSRYILSDFVEYSNIGKIIIPIVILHTLRY